MIKRYDPEIERGWETCDDEARMVEIKGGHYIYAQDLHYELRTLVAKTREELEDEDGFEVLNGLLFNLDKLLEQLK